MKKKLTLIASMLAITICAAPVRAQWVQTNGLYGGTVNCFAVIGTNRFAGTGNPTNEALNTSLGALRAANLGNL